MQTQIRKHIPRFEVRAGTLRVDGKIFPSSGLHVLRKLGEGANGVVFEARDVMLDRGVALKVWYRRIRSAELSRAVMEAQKLAKLSHPLLVTVHSLNVADKLPFAVMELVQGTTMQSWLKNDRPTLKDRCAMFSLVSQALHYVYGCDTVHGDPHTKNFFVFKDMHRAFQKYIPDQFISVSQPLGLKVADLGTSQFWASDGELRLRETRVLLETAGRMFHDLAPQTILDISGKGTGDLEYVREMHLDTRKAAASSMDSEIVQYARNLQEEPEILLSILDQFVLYSSLFEKLRKTWRFEAMRNRVLHDLAEPIRKAPYFRLSVVYDQLRQLGIPAEDAGKTIRWVASEYRQDLLSPLSSRELTNIERWYTGTRRAFLFNATNRDELSFVLPPTYSPD